jgi:hypothetical protein
MGKPSTPSAYYQVGLGKSFLRRASFIFSGLFLVTISLISGLIYIGIQNGELERMIVSPIKALFQPTQQTIQANPNKLTPPSYLFNTSATPKPTIKPKAKVIATPVPQQSQEDWFKQVQEENRRKSEESQKEYDQFVQDSNKRYEDFKNQSQQNYENFKNQ